MDRLDVLIECPSFADEVLERGVIGRSRHDSNHVKRAREVFCELSAIPGATVQVQDEAVEPTCLKSPGYSVGCGPLLSDEQDSLAPRQRCRDEVGDRLALAGAGRPSNDQVLAMQDGIDRVVLARVSVEDEEL